MSSACGHADLLRVFVRLGEPGLAGAAELMGYVPTEREKEAESVISFGGGEDRPAPPPDDTPVEYRTAYWRLERRQPVVQQRVPTRPHTLLKAPWRPPPKPSVAELTPWSALVPRIRDFLLDRVETNEPDVDAMVGRIADGQLIQRAPRVRRRRWGDSVQVIVDRSKRLIPFDTDQDSVATSLKRPYPHGAVQTAVWDDGYAEPIIYDARNRPQLYETPPPGTLVVVLGDLGCLVRSGSGSGAELIRTWEEFGYRLRLAGCRPVAVTPCPPARWRPDLLPSWTMLAWERVTGAGSNTEDELERRATRLLRCLSWTIRIEPGLLRDMRLFLGPDADAGTEADVWCHAALGGWLSDAAFIKPKVAEKLRAEFDREDLKTKLAVLQLIERWRGGQLGPEVFYEEILSLSPENLAQVPAEFRESAIEFFRRMSLSIQNSNREGRYYRGIYYRRPGNFDLNLPAEIGQALYAGAFGDSPDAPVGPSGIGAESFPPIRDQPLAYELRQKGGDLVAIEHAAKARDASQPAGSFLATMDSRNDRYFLEPFFDFWATGTPPPWADAWGCDGIGDGPWAEFSIPDARGDPVTQRLRWIPAGRFMMGSPDDEPERFDDEGPLHEVTVARGFWMFDTACRQALWRAVMGGNPSRFRGDDRPVETVSWNDAMDFIQRLNALKQGLGLALPSEAQWEYTARAQTDGPFSFGADIDPTQVNYNGDHPYARGAKGRFRRETVPVGSLPANPFGLYEMHGNVWEWCADVRHVDYLGAPSDGSAWLDGADEPGAKRVLRGGSWGVGARLCRSAARYWFDPDGRNFNFGFRPLARVQAGGAEPGGSRRIRPAERRIAASLSGGAARGRLVAGGPEARHDLPAGAPFVIRSDCEHLTFGLITRPDWATAIGRDQHGLWTRFEVKGERGETASQRLRWIQPGRFTMGSPPDEPGRFEDEGPAHEVTISSGFWLFDTPTTQAMWQMVMKNNPSEFKSPDRPVDSVSWNDCKAFLEKINGQPGVPQLALPTEAEWEYACRAGTRTALYTGPIEILGENNAPALDEIAWYGGNSGHEFDLKKGVNSTGWADKQYPHKQAGTRRVSLKAANSWGLHDMIGNVWEWCEDGRRDYGEAPMVDPVGPTEGGAERVLRGGSWSSDARFCRSAARNWFDPVARSLFIGFRPLARVQA